MTFSEKSPTFHVRGPFSLSVMSVGGRKSKRCSQHDFALPACLLGHRLQVDGVVAVEYMDRLSLRVEGKFQKRSVRFSLLNAPRWIHDDEVGLIQRNVITTDTGSDHTCPSSH